LKHLVSKLQKKENAHVSDSCLLTRSNAYILPLCLA